MAESAADGSFAGVLLLVPLAAGAAALSLNGRRAPPPPPPPPPKPKPRASGGALLGASAALVLGAAVALNGGVPDANDRSELEVRTLSFFWVLDAPFKRPLPSFCWQAARLAEAEAAARKAAAEAARKAAEEEAARLKAEQEAATGGGAAFVALLAAGAAGLATTAAADKKARQYATSAFSSTLRRKAAPHFHRHLCVHSQQRPRLWPRLLVRGPLASRTAVTAPGAA